MTKKLEQSVLQSYFLQKLAKQIAYPDTHRLSQGEFYLQLFLNNKLLINYHY